MLYSRRFSCKFAKYCAVAGTVVMPIICTGRKPGDFAMIKIEELVERCKGQTSVSMTPEEIKILGAAGRLYIHRYRKILEGRPSYFKVMRVVGGSCDDGGCDISKPEEITELEYAVHQGGGNIIGCFCF